MFWKCQHLTLYKVIQTVPIKVLLEFSLSLNQFTNSTCKLKIPCYVPHGFAALFNTMITYLKGVHCPP